VPTVSHLQSPCKLAGFVQVLAGQKERQVFQSRRNTTARNKRGNGTFLRSRQHGKSPKASKKQNRKKALDKPNRQNDSLESPVSTDYRKFTL